MISVTVRNRYSQRIFGSLCVYHSVLMTDPAVAYQPNKGYGTFDRGVDEGIFLKEPNGSLSLGVVWPGVTVFPGASILRVQSLPILSITN